jgi:hypothetical protein
VGLSPPGNRSQVRRFIVGASFRAAVKQAFPKPSIEIKNR